MRSQSIWRFGSSLHRFADCPDNRMASYRRQLAWLALQLNPAQWPRGLHPVCPRVSVGFGFSIIPACSLADALQFIRNRRCRWLAAWEPGRGKSISANAPTVLPTLWKPSHAVRRAGCPRFPQP
jgi:hypothetical protein